MRFARHLALLSTLIVSGGAAAGPACPDIVGTWQFALTCGVATTPDPHFGPRSFVGTVSTQDGCVFVGTTSDGFTWVGALAGDGNRAVSSDYGGAKATGELSARRGSLYTRMTFTYTFSGPTPGAASTACTGIATRD